MSVDKFGRYSSSSSRKRRIENNSHTKYKDFLLDSDNNINVRSKRIKNLGSPIENTDAVSKIFLFKLLNEHKSKIDAAIQSSQTIHDNEIEEIFSTIKNNRINIEESLVENIRHIENILDQLQYKVNLLSGESQSLKDKYKLIYNSELEKYSYDVADKKKKNIEKEDSVQIKILNNEYE